MTNHERWRALLRWLHRTFPARHPVTVRSLPKIWVDGRWRSTNGRPYQASCDYSKGRYHIEIRRQMCWALRFDAIIHEWAHALTWQGAQADEDDHSDEWSLAYGRIYRTYLKWEK